MQLTSHHQHQHHHHQIYAQHTYLSSSSSCNNNNDKDDLESEDGAASQQSSCSGGNGGGLRLPADSGVSSCGGDAPGYFSSLNSSGELANPPSVASDTFSISTAGSNSTPTPSSMASSVHQMMQLMMMNSCGNGPLRTSSRCDDSNSGKSADEASPRNDSGISDTLALVDPSSDPSLPPGSYPNDANNLGSLNDGGLIDDANLNDEDDDFGDGHSLILEEDDIKEVFGEDVAKEVCSSDGGDEVSTSPNDDGDVGGLMDDVECKFDGAGHEPPFCGDFDEEEEEENVKEEYKPSILEPDVSTTAGDVVTSRERPEVVQPRDDAANKTAMRSEENEGHQTTSEKVGMSSFGTSKVAGALGVAVPNDVPVGDSSCPPVIVPSGWKREVLDSAVIYQR